MMEPSNNNARGEAGVDASKLAAEAANQSDQAQCSNAAQILQSRSTSTTAQRAKLLALLQQGPKTTIELRNQGLMMPGVRVFELRSMGHIIESESVKLYDENGFVHPRCARYHLVKLTGLEGQP